MSDFWSTYKSPASTGSGRYLKSEDKSILIDGGVPFTIDSLYRDDENQYGPRYVAGCTIPDLNGSGDDKEEVKISFPLGSGVDSRDALLTQMEEYLDSDDGEPVEVKLAKTGRAINIVPNK